MNHQWILKLVSASLMRKRIFWVSNYPPHKVPINYKGQNSNFSVKKAKSVHISLTKWLQLKALRRGQIEITCLFNMTHWKEYRTTFKGISAQMSYVSILIHEETADKLKKQQTFYKITDLALFKNVKVIDKVIELRKPSRLKKTRDMIIINCCEIWDWILGNQNRTIFYKGH